MSRHPRPRTVTVQGQGVARVTPDVVRLTLRIGHKASGAAEALDGASHATSIVLEVLHDAGIESRDLQTKDVTVNQSWDHQGSSSGFVATQHLEVVVRQREQVGELLGRAAQAAGDALLVDGVRLDAEDRASHETLARESAFADARAKAEQYAALAGQSLADVLGVAESGTSPVAPAGRERLYAVAAGETFMPVEAGELDVVAQVTVTWELV